jgi:plasmid stabilization system protein ParE
VKFVVRSDARKDILRQFEYYHIEKDAETVANRFMVAVQAAISQVCRHPGIGAPKTLENTKLAGLRSWPVKGFSEIRVYYLVSKEVVRIIRVLHGKRDIQSLLEASVGVES